jgi:tetratricopeptide (TPR) repeat protein
MTRARAASTATASKARAQTRKRPDARVSALRQVQARRNLIVALCVLLAGVTITLYSPVGGHAFIVWDDQDYVSANSHIHEGLSWNTVKWAFTSTEAANWHPLTWLSHALDYQLFAMNPGGHHLDSVIIHALNAVLLFVLLAWATRRLGPSLLVAALFALHPLNVESVAWVAERKNVLSTLFFFLCIGAYVWYAQKPGWRRYLLVAALFVAGLMSKPMVITLPFVLLLLDYWPLDRIRYGSDSPQRVPAFAFSRLLLEKLPLLAFSAASAWITLVAQRPAERTFIEFPFAVRIENAVVAYGMYLWKMLWPAPLAFYPHPGKTLPMWQVILSAPILAGITALVVTFRRKLYLPVGWFWFLGTLVPVIGLVQVGDASMADRYAYIPLIGIFVMIAWSLADWAQARSIPTVWQVLPALCVLAALACVTFRQIGYWESDYDLWSHMLSVAETPFAHNAMGADLMAPERSMSRRDLAGLATRQERFDEARQHFERALELRQQLSQQNLAANLSEMAKTLISLGTLNQMQDRADAAREHYEKALQIYRELAQQDPAIYRPLIAATLSYLGTLNLNQNQPDAASQDYEEALQIYRVLAQQTPTTYLPNLAAALNHVAFLEANQNRIEEARAHYTEALAIYQKLAPGDPARYASNMANVEASLKALEKKSHTQ